jgi:hypothetical protein
VASAKFVTLGLSIARSVGGHSHKIMCLNAAVWTKAAGGKRRLL